MCTVSCKQGALSGADPIEKGVTGSHHPCSQVSQCNNRTLHLGDVTAVTKCVHDKTGYTAMYSIHYWQQHRPLQGPQWIQSQTSFENVCHASHVCNICLNQMRSFEPLNRITRLRHLSPSLPLSRIGSNIDRNPCHMTVFTRTPRTPFNMKILTPSTAVHPPCPAFNFRIRLAAVCTTAIPAQHFQPVDVSTPSARPSNHAHKEPLTAGAIAGAGIRTPDTIPAGAPVPRLPPRPTPPRHMRWPPRLQRGDARQLRGQHEPLTRPTMAVWW